MAEAKGLTAGEDKDRERFFRQSSPMINYATISFTGNICFP